MTDRNWKKNTGKMPVDGDQMVAVKFLNGSSHAPNPARDLYWSLNNEIYSITHWDYAAPRPVEETSTLTAQVGGDHYRTMTIQPWEAIEAWCSPEEVAGYHKATAIGYIAREQQKGGIEDIKKAIHHLQRLVEYTETSQ